MEPLNLEQQKKVARLYRKMEPKLKSSVRYHARKWNQQADDMEGAMREAFVKALSDYKPEFGVAEESLVHTYVNTKLGHEGRTLVTAKRLFRGEGSSIEFIEQSPDTKPSSIAFEKEKQRVFDATLSDIEKEFLAKLEKGISKGSLRKTTKFNEYNQKKMLPHIQSVARMYLL